MARAFSHHVHPAVLDAVFVGALIANDRNALPAQRLHPLRVRISSQRGNAAQGLLCNIGQEFLAGKSEGGFSRLTPADIKAHVTFSCVEELQESLGHTQNEVRHTWVREIQVRQHGHMLLERTIRHIRATAMAEFDNPLPGQYA